MIKKTNTMLKIENLSVRVGGKDILREINLEIKKAEIHALLGPNASGKSTLVYTMMGFPDYQIMEGEINFKGENIGNLSIEERVKLGIAVAFQHPPIIKGVKLSKLLEKISKQRINMKEFPIKSDLLSREINVGFSGGERKLSEIIQIISLNPSFVIFDELDSGLDVEMLEKLVSIITILAKNGEVDMYDSTFLNRRESNGISRVRMIGDKKSKIVAHSQMVANDAATGHVDCMGLLLSKNSSLQAIPELINRNKDASLTHEASVGKISEEVLNYLRSRGLTEEDEAIDLIITGFLGDEEPIIIKGRIVPSKLYM